MKTNKKEEVERNGRDRNSIQELQDHQIGESGDMFVDHLISGNLTVLDKHELLVSNLGAQ